MKNLNGLTRNEKGILKRMLERMFKQRDWSDTWYRNSCSEKRSLQKAIILIKLGVIFNAKSELAGKIFRTAAFQGNVEAVKYLLERGVDINATDRHKETALILATGSRCKEVVRLLLERGADVNAVNDCGNSALSFAKIWKDQAIIELLKTKGAK